MPKLIDADALIQATEAALTAAQKAGDTRETIKHNMLLCALQEAETVDPVHAMGKCYCRECKRFYPLGDFCGQHQSAVYAHSFCDFSVRKEAQDDEKE